MSRSILPAGDRGILVELEDLEHTLGFAARLRAAEHIPGVVDVVPAARTVLVRFSPARTTRADLIRHLRALPSEPADREAGSLIRIPVRYDGEDLEEVAAALDMTTRELIAAHTGREYRAAFAGFAPGFVYLIGGDGRLNVPRRAEPRTRIPAGSVALAGTFSGVYPRESPGGWQLIGTTSSVLWDADRDPPALVTPGDRVRFVAARGLENRASAAPVAPRRQTEPALHVMRAGARTLVQDAGRPGRGSLGVPESGAVDRPAMRLANALVGNEPDSPILEIAYGRFKAVARGAVTVAVTGARVPVTVSRRGRLARVTDQRAIALDSGDTIELGAPIRGVRAVLAARGGFVTPQVLGSCSTDTLSGLGPEPVRDGDTVCVGPAPSHAVATPIPWPTLGTDTVTVRVDLGPRDDWFAVGAIAALTAQEWTITPDTDRVGMRLLGGVPLERTRSGELPSEGAVTGSVQVPPNGQPVIFLADHPVTGGYPIIAVVRHADLAVLAQATPGMRVAFQVAETTHEEPR